MCGGRGPRGLARLHRRAGSRGRAVLLAERAVVVEVLVVRMVVERGHGRAVAVAVGSASASGSEVVGGASGATQQPLASRHGREARPLGGLGAVARDADHSADGLRDALHPLALVVERLGAEVVGAPRRLEHERERPQLMRANRAAEQRHDAELLGRLRRRRVRQGRGT